MNDSHHRFQKKPSDKTGGQPNNSSMDNSNIGASTNMNDSSQITPQVKKSNDASDTSPFGFEKSSEVKLAPL